MGERSTGYLNGLRALAAFWVLVAHCLIWGGHEGFIPNAKLAVAVFMVLSGYLMALTADDFTKVEGWRRFYLRRFFRLAPLYYLVLGVVAVSPAIRSGLIAWGKFPAGTYYSPANADFSLTSLALHASFLFGLSPQTATTTLLPDWSLSLEMQFYAAFPAIWLAVRRWGALRTSTALGAISLVVWLLFRGRWPDPSLLPLQLPYFLAGVLIFEARKAPALAILALAFAGFEASIYGAGSLVVGATVAAIFALDRWRLSPLRRALDNPITNVGADVSYAVYLIHLPLIGLAGLLHPPLWLLTCAAAVGATAIGLALHYAVERPGIALGRRAIGA